jgi:hypothetical protein
MTSDKLYDSHTKAKMIAELSCLDVGLSDSQCGVTSISTEECKQSELKPFKQSG